MKNNIKLEVLLLENLSKTFDLLCVDNFLYSGVTHKKTENYFKNHFPKIKFTFYKNRKVFEKKYSEVSFDIICFTNITDIESNINNIKYLSKLEVDILIFPYKKNSEIFKNTIKFLNNNNFFEWEFATESINIGFNENITDFFNINFVVLKKSKFQFLHNSKFVQNCSNDCFSNFHVNKIRGAPLQKQLLNLKKEILYKVKNNTSFSILRFGDGDCFFSNALEVGSAKPGLRAITIPYKDKDNFVAARKGIYNCDLVVYEIENITEGFLFFNLLTESFFDRFPHFRTTGLLSKFYLRFLTYLSLLLCNKYFRLLISPLLFYLKSKYSVNSDNFFIFTPPKYYFENVYCLVASKMIFKMFPSEIMLVGGDNKIEVIKKLSKFEEYRNYIGIKKFNSYVGVPQIGASDDEETILKNIKLTCLKNNPKVILLGIGSSKLFIIPRIKEFSNAVVIDIGAGIDALAGIISQDRPYFADWTNFFSSQISYKGIDYMDKTNKKRFSKIYRKKILN